MTKSQCPSISLLNIVFMLRECGYKEYQERWAFKVSFNPMSKNHGLVSSGKENALSP